MTYNDLDWLEQEIFCMEMALEALDVDRAKEAAREIVTQLAATGRLGIVLEKGEVNEHA